MQDEPPVVHLQCAVVHGIAWYLVTRSVQPELVLDFGQIEVLLYPHGRNVAVTPMRLKLKGDNARMRWQLEPVYVLRPKLVP
jgi:hypothetical protein